MCGSLIYLVIVGKEFFIQYFLMLQGNVLLDYIVICSFNYNIFGRQDPFLHNEKWHFIDCQTPKWDYYLCARNK